MLGLFSLVVISISGINLEAENVMDEDIPQDTEKVSARLPLYIQEYLSYVESEIETTNTVGAALTIVQGGEVLIQKGFGHRNVSSEELVDEHTVFRLASVSKGFAGVLAGLLDEDGIIDLDDPVTDYIPKFKLKNQVSTDSLTIRHILSHTSGLVPHAYDNLIEDRVPLGTVLERMDEVDISALPGKVYGYQNVMFSLIDTILRVRTELDYSTHLRDRVFGPLGMVDASTDFTTMQDGLNIAHPHVRTARGYVPVRLNKGYYNLIPAAGVNASISDLSNWLQALLGYRLNDVSAHVTELVTTPNIQTPLKRQYTMRWGKLDEKYYSLGWRIYDYRGIRIIYHGGYVRGYRAEIAFCPEEDIGIAFLQNSPNRLASKSIPAFFNYFIDMVDRNYDKHIQVKILPIDPIFPDLAGQRLVPPFP